MRKRSGALHSQSQEQFLMLAELSHQKTGYFYDETVHSQLNKQLKKPKSISPSKKDRTTYFEGFDFQSENKELQEQLLELSVQNKTNLVNITLICNSQEDIHPAIAKYCHKHPSDQIPSPERRGIDLHISNSKDLQGRQHCLKIWTIESEFVKNPLYHSYLKRSKQVLDFSEHQLKKQEELKKVEGILQATIRSLTH